MDKIVLPGDAKSLNKVTWRLGSAIRVYSMCLERSCDRHRVSDKVTWCLGKVTSGMIGGFLRFWGHFRHFCDFPRSVIKVWGDGGWPLIKLYSHHYDEIDV